jgi:hypothetical protein
MTIRVPDDRDNETYSQMRTDDRLDTRPLPRTPRQAIALTGIVGTVVIRLGDDSPCPLTGRVTGQIDEDRYEVAWADEQYSDNPRVTVEYLDELSSFPGRTRS